MRWLTRADLRLARRLTRRTDLVSGMLLVALPMAVFLGLFVTLRAGALTPQQIAERELARFGGRVDVGATGPRALEDAAGSRERPGVAQTLERVRALARGRQLVTLATTDLQLDLASRSQFTPVREAPWSSRPFGSRYTLRAGRWPSRAGEIALPEVWAERVPLGATTSAASRRVRLRVVGVVADRFARRSVEVLAGPGTWSELPFASLVRAGFRPSATVSLYAERARWDRVRKLVSAASPTSASNEPVVTRSVLLQPSQAADQRDPLAYQVPSTAALIAGVLLLLGLRARRVRRWTRVLTSTGVGPRRATVVTQLGLLALLALSVAAAIPAGLALGAAGRQLVDALGSQPLSPWPPVAGQAARLAALIAAVGAAAAATVIATSGRRPPGHTLREKLTPARGRALRAVIAVTGTCLVLLSAPAAGADSAAGLGPITWASVLVVAVLVPEAISAVSRSMGRRSLRWRAAGGRMVVDRPRNWALVATLVALVGPPVGLLSVQGAFHALDERQWFYVLPPGQLAIVSLDGRADSPPPQGAVAAAQSTLASAPIPVYGTRGYATIAQDGRIPSLRPSIRLVDNVADAQRLLGPNLTPRAEAALRSGGVVAFADETRTGFGRLAITPQNRVNPGSRPERLTPELPVAAIPEDRAWSAQASGFMLRKAATQAGLRSTVGAAVFDRLGPRDEQRVELALRQTGAPVKTLLRHSPYEALPVRPAQRIGLVVLLALTVAAAAFAMAASARSLRGDARSLAAIGMPRRWTRDVVLLQGAAAAVLGTAGGVLVAAVIVSVYQLRVPPLPMVVPGGVLAAVLAAAVAIVLGSSAIAVRQLTPRGVSS